MADATVREAFRSVLDGNPPDPNIRDLGPFTADYLSLIEVAGSGPAAVIRRFDQLVAANPAFARLMAGATGPRAGQSGGPRVYTIEDLERLPPVRYIDSRRELPADGVTVLYAPFGAGKSFVAVDYALCAAGTSSVAYVVGEGLHGMRARVTAWCKYHGANPPGFRAIGGPFHLLERRAFDALLGAILICAPDLVVIDPLARFIPGVDENDAGAMGEVVAAVDRIRSATGAGMLLLHHAGKNGELRGSSALPCAADQLTRLVSGSTGLTLKSEKSKDWEGFGERRLRLEVVPTGFVQADGRPETSCVVVSPGEDEEQGIPTRPEGKVKGVREEILTVLASPEFRQAGAFPRELLAATHLKEQSVRNTLTELRQAGLVSQTHQGDRYLLTLRGEDEVASQPRRSKHPGPRHGSRR